MSPHITIGPMTPAERNWVAATWKRSVLGRHRHRAKERLFQNLIESQTVLVARAVVDPDVGAGWICITKLTSPILHYIYVRGGANGVRSGGIGHDLIAAAGVDLKRPVITTNARQRDLDRAAGFGVKTMLIDSNEVLRH